MRGDKPFTKRDMALITALYNPNAPIPDPKKPRKKTDPALLEKAVQNNIMAYLKSNPFIAWVCRVNSGSFQMGHGGRFQANTKPGMSDIIGQVNGSGQFLAIEVKSATGKIKPHQQAFLDEVNASGGVAFMARSVADVETELSKII